MRTKTVKCFVWVMLLAGSACHKAAADHQPSPPVHAHATHEPHPPPPQGKPDEQVESWLDRIETTAATIKTLYAELIYDRLQQLVGDRQRRFGTLLYETGPPRRFAVHFDRLLVDRRLDHDERHYIFDGQWLVERYDDEKLFIKRQLTPPTDTHTPSQAPDRLAIGTGPFVFPIHINKTSLLQRFRVQLVPDPAPDPTTIHFRLVPKDEHPSQLTDIQLWYDRQTLLPVRIRTADESENVSVVVLNNVRLNTPIDRSRIDPAIPTDPGWRIEIKPWETEQPTSKPVPSR